MAKNILCRICWNTNNWVRPSGDAAQLETGGSYAAEHGFGHEEWLFNFAWRDDNNNKYAFLQPIGKNWRKYAGTDCKVTLYTKAPDGWYFVAVINPCHVLTQDEQLIAYELHRRHGWLAEMHTHLRGLNCTPNIFDSEGERIFNIKFRKQNTIFFDPFKIVPIDHKAMKFHRYQTLLGEIETTEEIVATAKRRRTGSRLLKSTKPIFRRGNSGGEFDPLHSSIQNGVFCYLQNKYGNDSAIMEEDDVDLKLKTNEGLTFIEVKGYHTPKRCIREALGQLLEYACWPPEESVDRFVVVGESTPDEGTCKYLKYLRKKYNLPIYYTSFDLATGKLGEFS